MPDLSLTVLVSGSGSTLQNLLDLCDARRLPARVKLVVGSREGLPAASRASARHVRYEVVGRKDFAFIEDHSARIFQLCDDVGTGLVVCAGWLTLLKVPLRYRNRVINVHPALLPSFGGKGMYGHHVHDSVLQHGCKIAGCTVHFVDDEYDHGPIILQRSCPVLADDTPESLAARVQAEERIALPEAIRLFHDERLEVTGRRVRIRE